MVQPIEIKLSWAISLLTVLLLAACTAHQAARSDIPVTRLTWSRGDAPALYLATDSNGVYRLSGDGSRWQSLEPVAGVPRVLFVTASPRDPDELFMGTIGGGLFRSFDGGRTWRIHNHGLTNTTVSHLVFDPRDPDTRFLLTRYGGVFQSSDSGDGWRPSSAGLSFGKDVTADGINQFFQLMLIPASEPLLVVSSIEGLFLKGIDAHRWTPVERFPGVDIRAMAYDQAHDRFYVAAGRQLYQSLDKGRNWSATGTPQRSTYRALTVSDDGETLYASIGVGTVLKSSDGGHTWQPAGQGLPAAEIVVFVTDPNQPSTVYAGLWGKGVYRSKDHGRAWAPVNTGIAPLVARSHAPEISKAAAGLPAAFRKCNVCHGWRDPALNRTTTASFYVEGTSRLWRYTVRRMNEREKHALGPTHPEVLTDDEEGQVIEFLQRYFARAERPSVSP